VPHRKCQEAHSLLQNLNQLEIREPHLRPVCQLLRDLMVQGRRDSSSAVLLIKYIADSLPAEEAMPWRALLPQRRPAPQYGA